MSPKIGAQQRLNAKRLVWELIGQCVGRQAILNTLQTDHGFTMLSSEGLYAEVWREIRSTEDQSIPERRKVLEVRLEEICRLAIADKQYAAAVTALRELKKMYAVDAPAKQPAQAPAAASSLAQRTDEDLEFYEQHDCWPEEVAQAKKHVEGAAQPARNPLDRLH